MTTATNIPEKISVLCSDSITETDNLAHFLVKGGYYIFVAYNSFNDPIAIGKAYKCIL